MIVKNFKKFNESIEMDEIEQNEENNFIVHKDNKIISAFGFLSDAFDNIVELIDSDGEVTEEEKYQLEDMISEQLPSVDGDVAEVDIDEVNSALTSILSTFKINSIYKITIVGDRDNLNEAKVYNSKGANVITKDNEIKIPAYQIPNSDDIIIGRTKNKQWIVKTVDGVMSYDTNEMEDIFILDIIESDFTNLIK